MRIKRTYTKTKAPVTVRLDAKAIGRRIKAARERRDWCQADLAHVVGVRPGTVANWETGVRIPTRDGLVRLGVALRRKVEWLLFGGRDYWWRRRGSPKGKDQK